jgi:hypothetical protein
MQKLSSMAILVDSGSLKGVVELLSWRVAPVGPE